jgi:dTDP-4-amino-4,6-dideoxygalactose transaminase
MGGSEQKYVQQAFDTNWIAPLGPNVTEFEKSIESYVGGGRFAACLSSGTAAIHLGLQLLGVTRGDEVICQSFTFSASANPIEYLGASPVFVDSEPATWNICPDLLRQAIEERIRLGNKPRAIIAVHLYGMPYLSEELVEISKHFEIPILEDSAEALGSSYRGIQCGTLGDISVLSFNGNKIITTSGGGALLTDKKELKDKAVFLATQARDEAPHYQHSHIGYNYRMSNVLAGIGRGQMEVLQDRIEARRKNYAFYRDALSEISEISFLPEPKGVESNRWLTTILTEGMEIREKIREALLKENIESRPLWKPMHLQPVFSEAGCYVNEVSEDLFNRGLCLPSGSNLTSADLERIVCVIKKVLL